MENFSQKTSLIWSIADILRGGWKQYEYQDVILPLVVIKRLDSILEDTKPKVLESHNQWSGKIQDLDPILRKASGVAFYNVSPYDLKKLAEDPRNIAKNFKKYLNDFSPNIRDIIEKFNFNEQIDRLEGGDLLYYILGELNKVDLHPEKVDNHQMGYIFEELLRKFSEMSNETAGEHYTPRDVIQVMVEILLEPDKAAIKKPHVIKTVYDPACGTGGMLTVAKDYIREKINKDAQIYLYGQELNSVTYAVAKSDMLIKGENPDLIRGGEKDHSKASTLANDQFYGETFDYALSNPPYGVDWKKDKDVVTREAKRGFAGRFGAGLPRISDGQLLFTQHLVSKMKSASDGGSRVAVVHNGSPLFTGDAGSGESEIRRWLLEKDLLEAIVALPDQLFYNTGINTYLWFLTNKKSKERQGKVQLIDARELYKKTRKSLGQKRKDVDEDSKKEIFKLYNEFKQTEHSKIFNTTDFGYRQITIERPLRLNFIASSERIALLKEDKAFLKLKPEEQENTITLLEEFGEDEKLYKNREAFIESLDGYTEPAKLPATLKKTILNALSERDETADICLDKDGKPEADNTLKDNENVQWGLDVYEYFEKEVKPYVPDAWINESIVDHKDSKVGIVGYEIPLTRYFYQYEPPRPLEEIEKDIEEVENELLTLLKQL
ncbi:type I restriction-modification system subunit M [Candidatus Pacebacteria bacterium]|nr:type I restriction-modification system subunit M [Candidatus Paceibacterota bacterium]